MDVAAKLPGRVAEIKVDEGDFVKAGEIVARMDTQVLEAQLAQAQAQVRQAENAKLTATSLVAQRESEKSTAQAVVAQRQAELTAAQSASPVPRRWSSAMPCRNSNSMTIGRPCRAPRRRCPRHARK